MTGLPRPPYDLEIEDVLASMPAPEPLPDLTPADVYQRMRDGMAVRTPEELIGSRDLVHHTEVLTRATAPSIQLAVFQCRDHVGPAPVVYVIHGGGMIAGNRFNIGQPYMDWVERFGIVVVSVDYRLAPEHPYPAPLEDCYDGLLWLAREGGVFGADAERILVAGGSAGGGLAAAVALVARDQGGPSLVGQMLICPMLDDRNDSVSARQFSGTGFWDRESNQLGWDALLGERVGGPDVPEHAAPARAKDLSGLPPAFIEVGSAEVMRDEDVAYASAIWAAGGSAELHVWPGGHHGFETAVPQAGISVAARNTREQWLRRTLGVTER
jgi:acetyl esterase/lipase